MFMKQYNCYFQVALFLFLLLFSLVYTQVPLSTECDASNYFDTSILKCTPCSTLMVSTPTSPFECTCENGYKSSYQSSLDGETVVTCTSCMDLGMAASRDHSRCMLCDLSANSSLSTLTQDCVCPTGSIIVEKDQSGNYLPNKVCMQCPPSSTVSLDGYSCLLCPDANMFVNSDGKCICNSTYTTVGSQCFPKEVVRTLQTQFSTTYITVSYRDLVGGGSVDLQSAVFNQYFVQSSILCGELDPSGCQTLANLCVLQEYNTDSPACKSYLQVVGKVSSTGQNGIRDWPSSIPWLYYTTDTRTVVSDVNIQMKVAFHSSSADLVSTLTFYLAVFTLNGTFLGFEKLSTQLILCEGNDKYLNFGNSYVNKCNLDLSSFTDPSSQTTLFYDLYILDEVDGLLKPIPTRIRNLRKSSILVNDNGDSANDIIDDVLTRRFFLYDNLSGRELSHVTPVLGSNIDGDTSFADTIPTIIRYASSIELIVTVQDDNHQLIYPPILNIRYADVYTTQVLAGNTYATSFTTEYLQNLTQFWHTALILLIIGLAIGGILWGFRMFQWIRRNQHPGISCTLALRGVLLAWDCSSDIIFWLVFAICCYWYLFFKGQDNVFVLTPLTSTLHPFITLIVVAFVGKVVRMVDIIWKQTHIDIFFVDWEKSRGRLASHEGDSQAINAPVSIWRTLFIANEWNEIQTMRQTSVVFTLIFVGFFMRGIGLEYLATSQPNTHDLTPAPTNMVLRFCITSFFWLLISLIQVIYFRGIHFRYIANPLLQFQDLLSVSNLSLFALSEHNSGYYIHGHSVHPHADTHMLELNQNLKKEEDNLCATRGLVPNSTQQTFEIFVSHKLREQFDNIYLFLLAAEGLLHAQGNNNNNGQAQAVIAAHQLVARNKVPPERLIKAYSAVNKFLSGFIDHNQPDHPYQVLTRTTFQQSVNLPPDLTVQNQSIFYPCGTFSVAKLLFLGLEYDLLLFDILLYSLVDFGGNTLVSMLVTFLVDTFFRLLREWGGRRKISRKFFVDDRFFILYRMQCNLGCT
eukprot:TRINITY_DN476_c0_g2_i2.p1 TRINITY_DN476_c0_g2~~TRINITY_DN476_c0_g2_i2.p1  ORF type:complete len:1026 (+),score=149.84 TRINITY_DN476_c0_g2_i2:116-3193(+)